MIVVTASWLKYINPFIRAMALFPFVLVAEKSFKEDDVLINHEKIHLRQQLELLVLPFYILYLIHYSINLLKYKSHWEAYHHIVFEREAYQNERNLDYLNSRGVWAFQGYWKK
ncbi:hypothetical protein AAG747_01965 [Rapidithrix thailandica]|uniref:Peptidase M56 domain-containing protein n=1 Tax=Rapidithrix thailandica TaxID=413964 RepID=A0AAW9S157_9BACT